MKTAFQQKISDDILKTLKSDSYINVEFIHTYGIECSLSIHNSKDLIWYYDGLTLVARFVIPEEDCKEIIEEVDYPEAYKELLKISKREYNRCFGNINGIINGMMKIIRKITKDKFSQYIIISTMFWIAAISVLMLLVQVVSFLTK